MRSRRWRAVACRTRWTERARSAERSGGRPPWPASRSPAPSRQAHVGGDAVAGRARRGARPGGPRGGRGRRPGARRHPGRSVPVTGPSPRTPDPWRTCFERDRDRILHSAAFRRLAGKTQVFIFPADHQRTRLTHALEVAQVATAIARACRLNVALVEAIALGHDCGHGPGGHASRGRPGPVRTRLRPRRVGRRRHGRPAQPVRRDRSTASATTRGPARRRPRPRARWWAWPTGSPTAPTTSRTPSTPASCQRRRPAGGGERERAGPTRSAQLRALITDIVATTTGTGLVGMSIRRCATPWPRCAGSTTSASTCDPNPSAQAERRHRHAAAPSSSTTCRIPAPCRRRLASGDPVRDAVAYVDGMTDRFACAQAVALLDWPVRPPATGARPELDAPRAVAIGRRHRHGITRRRRWRWSGRRVHRTWPHERRPAWSRRSCGPTCHRAPCRPAPRSAGRPAEEARQRAATADDASASAAGPPRQRPG